jgi:hypothetical protein
MSLRLTLGVECLLDSRGVRAPEIDMMAFVFLLPVEKTWVDHFIYPGFSLDNTENLSMTTLLSVDYVYDGTPKKVSFKGNKSAMTTATWNDKFTSDLNFEMTFKAGIPLVSTETKVGIKLGYQKDWGGKTDDTVVLDWNEEYQMNGPNGLRCTASVSQGKFDVKYKGVFHLVVKGDNEYKFETSGTLKNVSYLKVVCSEEDILGEARELVDGEDRDGVVVEELTEEEHADEFMLSPNWNWMGTVRMRRNIKHRML